MSERDIVDRQFLHSLSTHKWAAPLRRLVSRAGADPMAGTTCRVGDASCASAHAATLSRAASAQHVSVHRSLRHLQRQNGNRYVGQVLRQADAVGSDTQMDAIERSIDQARGGGQSMDHATRTRMEAGFGADFSGVRIHADARADGLSQSLSARAFTTGRDVFFRQGEYNPGTSGGRELLAHELTHVVQQNGDGIQRKMTVSDPGDAHEVEADRMAQAIMQQEHTPATAGHGVTQRQEERDDETSATKRSQNVLQRQPEAPSQQEEEEKQKLQMKFDSAVLTKREAFSPPD
jgi:hypothetical protein